MQVPDYEARASFWRDVSDLSYNPSSQAFSLLGQGIDLTEQHIPLLPQAFGLLAEALVLGVRGLDIMVGLAAGVFELPLPSAPLFGPGPLWRLVAGSC